MVTQPKYSIVIPLLNKPCTIPLRIPISLGGNTAIRLIRPHDLATISARSIYSFESVHGATKTISISDIDDDWTDTDIRQKALAAVFVLNVLSQGDGASVASAYVLKTVRSSKIHKIVDISGHSHAAGRPFTIKSGLALASSERLYSFSERSMGKDKSMGISLSRFCSALSKPSVSDRLIDICICLESIFSSQNEISFRFALFNALLADIPVVERHAAFKLLKKLYDNRSKVVHGNAEVDEAWFNEHWMEIVKLTKMSLIQKIDFLQDRNSNEWQEHLDKLALGILND